MPDLPISRNQLDRLGDRLRDALSPAEDDLNTLEAVLAVYDEALQSVRADLRDLGFEPTARLKTTSTTVDKLRRDRSSSLKTVQDLAGARVVIAGGLRAQDAARDFLLAVVYASEPAPLVIDRREDPRSGYRAVHIVVKVGGIPVEIQVRTELQDLWAQIFERLADVWGRQIRYGGDPTAHPHETYISDRRCEIVAMMMELSKRIADLEAARAPIDSSLLHAQLSSVDGVGPDLGDLVEIRKILGEVEITLRRVLAAVEEEVEQEVRRA